MAKVSKQVFSSNVDVVSYDAATAELGVTWKNGRTSIYDGVPAEIADQCMSAWSVGKFIKQSIIPIYPHRYK